MLGADPIHKPDPIYGSFLRSPHVLYVLTKPRSGGQDPGAPTGSGSPLYHKPDP